MVALLPMLAGLGIDFVKDLITDNGEDLVKEGIKKVTGIDLNKTKKLTPEDAEKINSFKLELERLDFKKLQLELDAAKEANRHEEHAVNKQVEDSSSAREMFKHGSELQTKVANDIMSQTQWRIPLWMLLNLGLLIAAESLDISATVVLAAGNLIGMALKSDYDERTGVRNFLFGAMIAKVKKKGQL